MSTSASDNTSELRDAYRLAAVANRTEIAAASKAARGTSKRLLQAIGAQYEGDVDRAVSILHRLITRLPLAEKAYIADVLAPILIMRHDTRNARALARILSEADWKSSARSFLALVEAKENNIEAALRAMTSAKDSLDSEDDDIIRFRVLQRLALTAFFLRHFDEAIDLALASANISSRHEAWRAASGGYSIAYNIHHDVTGNLVEADRFARLCRESANKNLMTSLSYIHT